MGDWIEDRERHPPQNERLIFARYMPMVGDRWEHFSTTFGVYRFGIVRAFSGMFYLADVGEEITALSMRTFWRRIDFPLPHETEGADLRLEGRDGGRR